MSVSLGFAVAVTVGEIVPAAIGLYAAYWVFSIRRALAGRIYRNHVLWLGVVCILFSVTGFLTYSTSVVVNDALNIYYVVLVAVLFTFIDSTVRLARRSDPLFRSILRWEKLRIALWADIIGLVAFFTFISVVNPVPPTGSNGLVANILITALFTVPFIVGGPALLIGARRSKDPVLQAGLKWLGLVFILLIVGGSLVSAVVSSLGFSQYDSYYSYAAIPSAVLSIISSYALCRSSRSLSPLNRLSAVKPDIISPATTAMS